MRIHLQVLAFLVAAIAVSGCSTILTGTSQGITVTTNPTGATCTIDRGGQRVGAIAQTPNTVQISKSASPLDIECSKEGFQTASLKHKADFAGATVGNLLLGGVIGVAVDAASGASSIYPSEVRLALVALPRATSPLVDVPTRDIAPVQATSLTTQPSAPLQQVRLASSPVRRSQLQCPAAGVRVERSDGSRVIYEGVDAGNPDICILSINGREARLYFGLWSTDGGTSVDAYNALRSLNPELSSGPRSHDWVTFGNVLWNETWDVVGRERVKVDGLDRDTIHILRDHKGSGASTTYVRYHHWMDAETGAELRQKPELIRGGVQPPGWTALSLKLQSPA